jgi:asparagine synthase (glutamine-hydrolysing)
MCGVIGHVLTRADEWPDSRLGAAAVALLKHRGPDDDGIFTAPGIFLGHTRLSITGISHGHQPVTNESGSILAVFNGEIYNHRELRRDLTARGHRMDGESDSAVLPHAYEEWGPAFVERLEGIFAVAVWDGAERTLVLARDRFGIKPLYYAHDPDGLVFGSEVKAVAVCRRPPAELDVAAVGDYLAFGYVPPPRTILRGVSALPPATCLTWRDAVVTGRTYWSPKVPPGSAVWDERGERAALARIDEALTGAVGRECTTETPAGAFLSGGLDSSTITALMSEHLGRPFPTFHVGLQEATFGEQDQARLVSQRFGTEHHEITCSAGQIPQLLPRLVWHLDNPVADVSSAAEFLVAELARRHVKVVLSGDGADEVLAGYATYKADRLADAITRAGLRRPVALALGAVEPLVPIGRRKLGFGEKLRRFRQGLAWGRGHPHVRWRTIFAEEERAALVEPDARAAALEDTWTRALGWLAGTEDWPMLTRLQWLDMRVWLDGCVLRKVDALAMAHAIEVRVPFLDHRVVDAVFAAPPSLRLRGRTDKYALRQLMANRLPEAIRRRPKAPFQMPMDIWFRGPLRGFAREQLREGLRGAGFLSTDRALALLDAHAAGRQTAGIQLWTLVTLAGWLQHVYARLPALRTPAPDLPAAASLR